MQLVAWERKRFLYSVWIKSNLRGAYQRSEIYLKKE